jgi:hypothetical protein
METLRLRRIQEPSRVERLLEAYISRAGIVPDNAYQIRNRKELPRGLQLLLVRAIEEGQVWSCWADPAEVWLFTCHMSLAQSRERGAPVLLVHLYGADAELIDSGAFRYDPLGSWSRCGD